MIKTLFLQPRIIEIFFTKISNNQIYQKMKKVYTLIAAMLIASISFAQIATTPQQKVVKTDGVTYPLKGKPAVQQQRASNAFWFNLIEDAIAYYGIDGDDYSLPIIQCDTNNLVHYQSGDAHNQFCSLGQVYDFEHHSWEDMYNYTGAPQNVPYMPDATSYSIDSIQIAWYYGRGTNVPASVVDTVAISYVIGLQKTGDDRDIYVLGHYEDTNFVGAFAAPLIPFNHSTFLASTTCDPSQSGLANDLEASTVIYDKIPLTIDDTTGSYVPYFRIPAPAALSNLDASKKQLAVIVTFIPGMDRTPASVIGEDLDRFSMLMYDDPRDGYTTNGSDELLHDCQAGLFHDADNFQPSQAWYPIYQPNNFWVGNPKPSIGLHVICNDCGVVNVPEIEKNNITVYPNPATNNFTVNLGNDEKANIQLFNIVGQLVYNENIVGTAQVNVANLHTGVYMLKVNQNGKVYTTKVVVR